MKRGTTKALKVSYIILVIFFTFSAFAFLPQSVQAQTVATTIVAPTALSGPVGMAISPNGTFAYVANTGNLSPLTGTGGTTVAVINTATNTVTATVVTGDDPVALAVTPNGQFVFVANHGGIVVVGFNGGILGTVSVISTATNTVTATISAGFGSLSSTISPNDVAITPNGAYAYVTSDATNTVSVISTATNTVTATVTLPSSSYPSGVAIAPNGTYAYVTNSGSGTVSVISTATNAVTATINVGTSPSFVSVAPNGAYAYVTNSGSGTISVISTATNTVAGTINVGTDPYAVAVTPNNSYAYVVNHVGSGVTGQGGGGTVSVISTATNTVTATVNVGNSPAGVAFTSNGAYAYVPNQADNSVSVINTVTTAPTATPVPSATAVPTPTPVLGPITLPAYPTLAPTSAPTATPTVTPTPQPTTAPIPEFPAQFIGITLVISMIIVLSAVIIAKNRIKWKNPMVLALLRKRFAP
jgi:YVTN family beta-propeller protein